MKNSKILVLFFFILLLAGCKNAEEKEWERVDNLCNEVTFDTVKQLTKSHSGLQFAGMGGGGVYGINLLTVHFDSREEMNIEEGRKLIVECTEKFLENINKNENLRPELLIHPFLPNNVEITISFLLGNKEYPLPPNLCFIACRKGKVKYYVDNKGDNELMLEESYEKALEIVKKQSELLDMKRQ